jgi:mediator of replication checkpoint protein 1
MGGKGEGVKMAMGGEKGKTAKRGVRFFTREEERKRGVEEGERRREEKLLKRMEGRRKEVGGLFGRGSFA